MTGTPQLLNSIVLAVFLAALYVALVSWLLRTGRVVPFSRLGRILRATSEPVMRPVETRVARSGGNPVNAGWWLIVGVAVAGILILGVVGWGVQSVAALSRAASGGTRLVLAHVVDVTYKVLVVALIVRVVGSWFGVGRYRAWMRPAYWLTDWVVSPIHRLLPPFGTLDLSPLVAWLALLLLRSLVIGVVL